MVIRRNVAISGEIIIVSIRKKNMLCNLLVMVSGLAIITISLLNIWFLLGFIVLFAAVDKYNKSVKCVYCGALLLYNDSLNLGVYVWTSWIPEKCPNCGRVVE